MFVYESLTMHIWKIIPVRAGVEGAGVNLGYCCVLFDYAGNSIAEIVH